jgi:ABC-type branched-subunit amino acid transport system ATPase component
MVVDDHDPVIAARGLRVSYGSLPVLFGVDLAVERGKVLAVLGANGAGKTTLLAALAGLIPVDEGTVAFLGEDVTSEPAERRIRRGLALVQGGAAIFPALTVADNLRAGAYTAGDKDVAVASRRASALRLFPVLEDRLDQRAGTLSGGERQMLAIAKGLLLGGELLCIDELSLGLAPVVVDQLTGVVEQLRDEGRTMIIVEQSVALAVRLADDVLVMERGRVILSGETSDLSGELAELEAALLGASA